MRFLFAHPRLLQIPLCFPLKTRTVQSTPENKTSQI